MARSIATTRTQSSRNRGVLLLAVIFGLLSAVLVFAFVNSQTTSEPGDLFDGSAAAESVVVANRDIQLGERITADMLTTKTLPGAALQAGRFQDTEALVGKVAITMILSGEQVVGPKVTTFEARNTLAFKVPAGKRALGLMVPHEGWIVGGLAQPGDRVDVVGITLLSATDPLTGQEKVSIVSGLIAENVEVLAVSQTMVRRVPNLDARSNATNGQGDASSPAPAPASSSGGGVVEDGESFEAAISITLAMTVEEASKTAMIDAMDDDAGQYRILVRQTGDAAPTSGQQAWRLEDLFTLR